LIHGEALLEIRLLATEAQEARASADTSTGAKTKYLQVHRSIKAFQTSETSPPLEARNQVLHLKLAADKNTLARCQCPKHRSAGMLVIISKK